MHERVFKVYAHIYVRHCYKPLIFQSSLILQLITMLAMCFHASQLSLQIISTLGKEKGFKHF